MGPFSFPCPLPRPPRPCHPVRLPSPGPPPETLQALPQEHELAGRAPEPFTEQPHADVLQLILLQIELGQAGAGAERGGQGLAAAGREAAADQSAGETRPGPP